MCCNIHGLILYLAKVALVAVELCEFALVWISVGVFFSSSLYSASLQAGFSALEMSPLFTQDPAGSNTITVKSLMSQLIQIPFRKKTMTKSNNHKKVKKKFEYFYQARFLQGSYFSLQYLGCVFFCLFYFFRCVSITF